MTSSDTVEAVGGECMDDGPNHGFGLLPGEFVEAKSRSGLSFRGLVDDIAPESGVIWIFEDPLGTRRMLDLGEYSVSPLPS
ncbi:hypothetical protein [Arthrobacter crystallopoietes]|uniref:Uncharacterized protein n=1 Tax=Crystallibacter crystallopoietes TaxID=37928 RepID=A0A1H1HVT0_9MICC|nr:hypothetical protein [Arthrobacter crystallopoietes]AUI53794.1 hypothetical protein AC20117_22910 [Arthrobacter crystallopoietes]SDR29561.1 hypothetical protein SAMN04489742_4712 [Arthrobacter crystallopoietes]